MRVLVIGQSLPGLMAAHRLQAQGHQVTIIGLNDARSTIGLGSMYLWDTPEMREYLLRDMGFGQNDLDESADYREVKFAIRHSSGVWAFSDPNPDIINAYKKKVDSDRDPCRGIYRIDILDGFLPVLRNRLLDLLQGKITWINGKVVAVEKGFECRVSEVMADRSERPLLLRFDGIVNTISRDMFERIRGHEIGVTTKNVHFYFTSSNYYGRFIRSQGVWSYLVYDANPEVPWHRMSVNIDGEFMYESLKPMEEATWRSTALLPAKVKACGRDLPCVPGIVHLGRWAELDPDLMVSDIPSRLSFINFD